MVCLISPVDAAWARWVAKNCFFSGTQKFTEEPELDISFPYLSSLFSFLNTPSTFLFAEIMNLRPHFPTSSVFLLFFLLPHLTQTLVPSVRTHFPLITSSASPIYLDSSATSQKPTFVLDKMKDYEVSFNSNVHRGAHRLSRTATEMYEDARDKVGE